MEATTQTKSPSDTAREMFHTIFEERDLSDPHRYWTDESVDVFLAAGETVRGADALAQWFRELLAAFPDLRLEIENVFDDGERQAVVQWRGTGTHSGGPFVGIEPSGRKMDMRGVDVFRFDADGKVDLNTVYYDGAELARQFGMLPPRDSALDNLTLNAFNAATRLKRRVQDRAKG